jgi:hypothetical protein
LVCPTAQPCSSYEGGRDVREIKLGNKQTKGGGTEQARLSAKAVRYQAVVQSLNRMEDSKFREGVLTPP